jgi:flagellar biogenesis protein FliO
MRISLQQTVLNQGVETRNVPIFSTLFALSMILQSAASVFAFAPQSPPEAASEFGITERSAVPGNSLPGGNSLPSTDPQNTSFSNEVRVDPFVAPAASYSSPATTSLPYKSSGSEKDTVAIPTRNESSAPETFNPSSSSSIAQSQSLLLKPRTSSMGDNATEGGKPRASSFGSVLTMFSSLIVVLAIFFGFMLMLKKANRGSNSELPRDVFQVLGTSRIAGRHSLFLLRLGHKLVLVHAGSGEVQTITEVTDPAEVDRLCGSCEENQPNSLTQSFRQVLKNVTEGGTSKPKSFSDHLKFRRKAAEDVDEVSPAVALLAKEKA